MAKWLKRSQRPRSGDALRDAPGRTQESGFDWKTFDAVAADYERVHAPYTLEVGRDLLALAETGPNSLVVDVGTGTGSLVDEATARTAPGGRAVGVEPSVGMLRAGKATHPSAALVAGDVLDLPFPVEMFDVAVANFSMPYFRKLDTALFDIMRVLKPSGRLAASAWTGHEDEFTKTWRGLVEEAVGLDVLRGGLKDEAPWAETLSDKQKFETIMRDAGLRPVGLERRMYRFRMTREDYVVSLEVEATGRFVRSMLGPRLWESFRGRVRAAFAERFPEHIVDLREALLAVGTKPR